MAHILFIAEINQTKLVRITPDEKKKKIYYNSIEAIPLIYELATYRFFNTINMTERQPI